MGHEQNGAESGHSLELNKSDLLEKHDQKASEQQSQGALSTLWQAAYENPYKTGLGVAAAVGVGALAYSMRGQIAERLLASKPNVLIIEDTPMMGMAMRDALKESGHKVTWVTGISKLNPLTAVTETGSEISLAGNRKFQVALLDGDLGKNMLTGPELVASLKRENIVSIGTSTVADFNIAMKANGAPIASSKPAIFASLVGNRIDLKQALKAPQEAQAGLDLLAATLNTPENKALRKAADAKLMAYLKS